MRLSQIELIGAITKNIARQAKACGVPEPGVIPRQYNAIIEAANLIVDAFTQDFTPAEPGSGIPGWLRSDDRGMSSEAMLRHLALIAAGRPVYWVEVRQENIAAHPHDPADLWRCIALLDAAPELRPHVPRMAELSAVWAALAEHWDELEALCREERPSGKAPKCYARMRQLIEVAEAPKESA